MTRPVLLEISASSEDAAAAAERGGAQRIELCRSLDLGGLTPGPELMRRARKSVQLPIFAMIRPRAGDFIYSQPEIADMLSSIGEAKRLGMNGVVLGVLTAGQQVDIDRSRELVKFAYPLPATFHRAFDGVGDLHATLEAVIEAGATRVLTSGGAPSAAAGIDALASLSTVARERIIVLPGGGINSDNVLQIVRQTGAREIHSALGSVLAYEQQDYDAFESEVQKLVTQLRSIE